MTQPQRILCIFRGRKAKQLVLVSIKTNGAAPCSRASERRDSCWLIRPREPPIQTESSHPECVKDAKNEVQQA